MHLILKHLSSHSMIFQFVRNFKSTPDLEAIKNRDSVSDTGDIKYLQFQSLYVKFLIFETARLL